MFGNIKRQLFRFLGIIPQPKPENDGKQPWKSNRGPETVTYTTNGFKQPKKHPTRPKFLRMKRREANRIRAINRMKY